MRVPAKPVIVGIFFFFVHQAVRYILYLLNIPFVLSLMMMLAVVVITLHDVYGIEVLQLLSRLPFVGSRIPSEFSFHLDTHGFMRFYAATMLVFFLVTGLIRYFFNIERPTLRWHFLAGFIVATAGWGFVIANVPMMRVASGTSRTFLAAMFGFFCLLGAGAFGIGSFIAFETDVALDRLRAALTNGGNGPTVLGI